MADGVRVGLPKRQRLLRRLARTVPGIEEALGETNAKTAHEMAALARQFVPEKSGDLKESIVVTPPGQIPAAYSQGARFGNRVADTSWLVTVGNSAVRYAHLVEFGAAPHVIRPKNRSAMKFVTADGNTVITRQPVSHPGAPAQPFFYPAYRIVARKHKGRITRAINKRVKQLAIGAGAE